MAQSCSPCWPPHPSNPQRRRITHVMAVFSDQWNWSFSPSNARSRRQRFCNSGETISGFTAVFCDDWKDSISEGEVIDDHIWSPKRGRDEGVDFPAEYRDASKSLPPDKRQHLESPIRSPLFSAVTPTSPPIPSTTSSPEAFSFTAASFEHRSSQFDRSGSDNSPSLGDSGWNDTPRSLDDIDDMVLTPNFAFLEDPLPNPPTSLNLDIAAIEKLDGDSSLTLVSQETEIFLTAGTNLTLVTKTSNGMLDSCEEALGEQGSPNDEGESETSGFEFWNDFMKCCMDVDGDDKVGVARDWNIKGPDIRAML